MHWLVIITLIPLACLAMTSLGLLLGTTFEPRNIGLMFGFVVLPLTFLGGTYYQWTQLAPVKVAGIHWLQILVLVNPLIYVTEGMRAGLTAFSHMHLYIIYPVLLGFCAFFLWLGLRNFRRRVLVSVTSAPGMSAPAGTPLRWYSSYSSRQSPPAPVTAGPSSPSTKRSRRSRHTCQPAASRAALSRVPSATVRRNEHPSRRRPVIELEPRWSSPHVNAKTSRADRTR